MSEVTPIFVFHSLNVNRGGLTKAVMTRANMLANHFDNVLFFTFFYQKNHKKIIEKLYDSGKLDRKVKVYNLFTDLNPYTTDDGTGKMTRFFAALGKGKVMSGIERLNKKTNSWFKGYAIRAQCKEYDGNGKLIRIRNMDPKTKKPFLDRYIHEDGRCYLNIEIDPETGKEGRCKLYDPDPVEFKNPEELCVNWISKKIKGMASPVIMADSRHSYYKLLKIQSSDVKRVVILHNNHNKNGCLRGALKPLFNSIHQYDGLVVLTEEQRDDIIKEFGALDNCFVLPHGTEPSADNEFNEKIEYDRNLVVTLARLERQKRLDEAIRSFRYVLEFKPDARYEIYGDGSEKQALQNLIDQLGLKNHVKLMGYTNNPVRIYKKATCTILTSDYEGSPLVFFESLAVGTPVVTYRTKYGAKDLIRDGLDGYLVEKGNQKELAEKIVHIMERPELREKMSKYATEATDRYSFQKYETRWVQFIKNRGLHNRDMSTELFQ